VFLHTEHNSFSTASIFLLTSSWNYRTCSIDIFVSYVALRTERTYAVGLLLIM